MAQVPRELGGYEIPPSEQVDWLLCADKAVSVEIFSRLSSIDDPYHIGARVVVLGLKKATRLNGERATVTRKEQGGRYGVIFDVDGRTTAVRPAHLTPLERVSCQARQPCQAPSTAEERAMVLLTRASEALVGEGFARRRDIASRIEAVFVEGKFDSMECGAPKTLPPQSGGTHVEIMMAFQRARRCCGNGKVDFVALAGGGGTRSMREWLLSGLCQPCQEQIFCDQ